MAKQKVHTVEQRPAPPNRREREGGLAVAIERVGSLAEIARRIGVTPQNLSRWDEVPLDWVLDVEAATGVPRSVLRPDYFLAPAPPRKRERRKVAA